ncbi:DUF6531 domain-containing protein [Pseudomonas sp. LB3P93]
MQSKLSLLYSALFFSLILTFNASAEEYYWYIQTEAYAEPEAQKQHSSPEQACRHLHENTEYGYYEYGATEPTQSENQWTCNFIYGPDLEEDTFGLSIYRHGDSCANNKIFDKLSGQCESESISNTCPLNTVGNPINFVTGYKTQSEQDFPVSGNQHKSKLHFTKQYNSSNGIWTHSYSSRLLIEPGLITLIHTNGDRSYFDKKENNYVGRYPEIGKLIAGSNLWIYMAVDNSLSEFDTYGKLSKIQKTDATLKITYTDKFTTVTDQFGNTLQFTDDSKKQPVKVTAGNLNIVYGYNNYKQLISMTRIYSGHTENKEYLYEDIYDSRLLTGIIDERGVRYATWAYDKQGRAISSEHSGGAGRTSINYNEDGSSTVTNELGKQARYQFEMIQNIKRIKAVEGILSAHCPDSNSSFAYNTRGLLETKTDNNGNITTYTYNERGLELSRTLATGTAHAKTITTEWHPTLILPVRITEPHRFIQYTYDVQGRQLSRTVTSR